MEQGEGARGDWVKSHFGKFVGILEDFLAMQAADPGFDPARPVEPAYVRLPPDVASGTLIEEPLTARVADLCNGLYELMLQVLSRYYVHHGETPAELETLARTAKHLMNWVMRQLCSVLTTLPIGPSHPGRTAGPTLEIARPAYFVLPHRDPAWKIINERLDVLTETCAALAREPGLAALGELAGRPARDGRRCPQAPGRARKRTAGPCLAQATPAGAAGWIGLPRVLNGCRAVLGRGQVNGDVRAGVGPPGRDLPG